MTTPQGMLADRSLSERALRHLMDWGASGHSTDMLVAFAKKEAARLSASPAGNEPTRAILFALELDNHFDRFEFLKGWSEGDTSEWPDFATFALTPAVAPDGAREAITDEMVNAALNAWFASPPSESDRGLEHSMRCALAVALARHPHQPVEDKPNADDALISQIDALLALDAKGATSPPIPGLARELLAKCRERLAT